MNESHEDVNPFPGLRPFETEEYLLFFGREGQSDELLARLGRSHFLAVVGTSGSGKSSLVRAGLLPALRGGLMKGAGSGWRIAVMRPGHDPVGNLACALAEHGVLAEAGGGLRGAEGEGLIEATLRTGSLGLVNAVQQARLAGHENLLVVVDQFEELFRFRAARAGAGDDAAAFVKLLLEAARQREHAIYVVITMRSDFLGDCAQFQGLPEAINDGQYLIPRMTRDERRVAITGPVAVARGRMTEPLVSRLLNDVGDNPDQLPILQHALMRTWDYWKQRRGAGEPIDVAHYEAIGAMSDALSRHADEAWDELPDERSRQIAEKMFRALTEKGADNRETRRPTRLREIAEIAGASEAEVVAVIEVFRRAGRSFLMPPAGVALSGEVVIDISHESLIRNWQRLKGWVTDEAQSARTYRRLAEAAVLHREGSEGLLQNPALEIALDWRERSRPNPAWGRHYHPEFELAVAYLEASQAACDEARAERERQRREEIERARREREQAERFAAQQSRAARRMRWLTFAMILLAMLSAGTAVYALKKRAVLALARDELKTTLGVAEQRKQEAEAARAAAERSLEELRQTQSQLVEKTRAAEENAARAEENATRASEANGRVQAALKRAETEAEHARQQADIAAAKKREAEAARDEVVASLARGSLLREGIEAYQREEFMKAVASFKKLRDNLKEREPNASAAQDAPAWQYAKELGWTLSNLGAAFQKSDDFDEAIKNYEEGLPIIEQTYQANDPIRLDTYQGLGHSYHVVARSRQEVGQLDSYADHSPEKYRQADEARKLAQEKFRKAEDFFGRALSFQEQHRKDQPAEVAGGHLNLARLHVDSGDFAEAEKNFEAAIKLLRPSEQKQKQVMPEGHTVISGGLDDEGLSRLTGALRELAEFYEEKQGRYDDAVRVFNDIISLREGEGFVVSLGDKGQEIANSYSDLAQIYAAKGEPRKAQETFAAANLLQRAALKARRMSKLEDSEQNLSKVREPLKELNDDLDELGGAYVRLGKIDAAEQFYLHALTLRDWLDRAEAKQQGSSTVPAFNRFESYHKLTTFYLQHKKNYAKAEEYTKLLTDAYKSEPQLAARYAAAQVQLADTYARDPNKAAEAAEAYERGLAIYAGQNKWMEENKILYKLDELHRKQKNLPERERAIQRRLDTLTRAFKLLAGPGKDRTKVPLVLVTEYLNAAERAGLVYGRNKKGDQAEDALRRTFDAYDFIVSMDYLKVSENMKVLDAYASVLDRYTDLLYSRGRKDVAAVVEKTAAVRKKRRELEVSQLEKDEQQDPAPSGAQ
jgi:tetratricopeptide (TPR) repeat protein